MSNPYEGKQPDDWPTRKPAGFSDACVAVGVAVLDLMADGAMNVLVSKQPDGTFECCDIEREP